MKDKVAWAKKLNKNMMFDGFSFVSLEIGTREETNRSPLTSHRSPLTSHLSP